MIWAGQLCGIQIYGLLAPPTKNRWFSSFSAPPSMTQLCVGGNTPILVSQVLVTRLSLRLRVHFGTSFTWRRGPGPNVAFGVLCGLTAAHGGQTRG